jgi:hypothetical protein
MRESATFWANKADFYTLLKNKYHRAASHPWLSIPADPRVAERET